MRQLHQKIAQRVNEAEDNVRLYWMTKDTVSQVLTIGSELPQEPPETYIV